MKTGTAIVASTGALTSGRRAQVLILDLVKAGINLTPNVSYYLYNGAWRKVGQSSSSDFGTDIIPAGSGMLIRKRQTDDGATVIWNNSANY